MKTDQKLQNLSFHFLLNSKPVNKPDLPEPTILNNFTYQEFFPTTKGVSKISFFKGEGFYLIYSLSGSIILKHNSKSLKLRCQQSCLLHDELEKGICIEFPKSPARFFAIGLGKPHLAPEEKSNYFGNLKDIFSKRKDNIYTGSINLEIYEKINALTRLPKNTVADKFIMEGILSQIYGLKTFQMLEERQQGEYMRNGFTSFEMEQLMAISEYIEKNPAEAYTVKALCEKTGLGPSKLQRGFRKMHHKTVIEYIRHKRLERALQLLKTSNLTISEIVYRVGFSSRSYFSKIFIRKYKCSPKKYQQSIIGKTA